MQVVTPMDLSSLPKQQKKQQPARSIGLGNYLFSNRSVSDDDDDSITADSTVHMQHSSDSEGPSPVSLEGFLQCRMGRSSGQSSFMWKRRFVYFSFSDGGSITVYKESPNFNIHKMEADDAAATNSVFRTVYNKLSKAAESKGTDIVDFDITPELPWMAKDVERDTSTFVVEIPTGEDLPFPDGDASVGETTLGKSTITGIDVGSRDDNSGGFDTDDYGIKSDEDEDELILRGRLASEDMNGILSDEEAKKQETICLNGGNKIPVGHDLTEEMNAARSRGKPLRIYFRCERGGSEKALWLRAFSTFGRLSSEVRRRKGFINSISAPLLSGTSRARIRDKQSAYLARDARNLDLTEVESHAEPERIHVNDLIMGKSPRHAKEREFRVQPSYAYPHRWMTRGEMRDEMVLPSEHFHDLRVPGCTDKEVGSLKVEVLQCLGLPKMDRTSETDAVVYMVCGAYSFSSDVIYNKQNPMWLRKCRRACNFPLFHGFASLYVGVFDYEPKKTRDDFAGRVEINLSRLRPGSVYDVTLPLRLSTHVYSRRKRGAVRLRLTLNWSTERDALLSYIPKKVHIPLPQNTTPNYNVTVRSTDPKAFRNIAITVHGAHLPGRFTFNQMRAAIREINYTRKFIFTGMRQSIRDLRHWQYPALSSYVFLSWMHCVYANQFSLVPAYVVLYFLIILMCNYVKYSTDGPGQRGFVPPSWEEMMMALVRGHEPNFRAIEPLELGPRKLSKRRRRSASLIIAKNDFQTTTHVPKGKTILKFLGIMEDKPKGSDPNEDHLEFPFANGVDYPKFGVKECLVHRKGGAEAISASYENHDLYEAMRSRSGSHDSTISSNKPKSLIPRLDVDLHDMMRKDSSGTKDYDEEEMNFYAKKVLFARGKKAKTRITKTAAALGRKTGIDSYVVTPLQSGLDMGLSHVNYISNHLPHPARRTSHATPHHSNSPRRNSFFGSSGNAGLSNSMHGTSSTSAMPRRNSVGNMALSSSMHSKSHMNRPRSYSEESDDFFDEDYGAENNDYGMEQERAATFDTMDESNGALLGGDEEIDPALVFPEQDIDIEGPNNGKKLTDDLAEIKDKMHELTWHLFDDQTYVVKNSNTVYFGDAKKPEKRRKTDVKKQIDKYLRLGQYSHSNPFVARVGMYVEPIIGSIYSFLCLFRAGFNVMTWQDPMFTFWLSIASGIAVIILFIFPWRLFLFVVGILLVGPQNWLIRIMREQGRLPPAPAYKTLSKKLHMFDEEITEQPTDAPIFTSEDRKPGNTPRKAKDPTDDPREIHHVVVPYTPLIYQRCYDWPPEPQFAQVKRELSNEKAVREYSFQRSLGSDPTSYGRQRKGIRNRFVRNRLNDISETQSVGHRRVASAVELSRSNPLSVKSA